VHPFNTTASSGKIQTGCEKGLLRMSNRNQSTGIALSRQRKQGAYVTIFGATGQDWASREEKLT
jgi:hypothetical protein